MHNHPILVFRPQQLFGLWGALVCMLLLWLPAGAARAEITVTTNEYHGWQGALTLGNGRVEAVIVPAVGRVMQFRFAGATNGPFWENRTLDGKAPDPKSTEWGNFGGDKTWPAPQGDWPKITKRGWPPPVAFDSMPVQAEVKDGTVTLVTAIDPHYGIRARRRIQLDPDEPVMTITTKYEKMDGTPQKVAVWVITQLKDPQGVFAPLPNPTIFKAGYLKQSEALPLDLTVGDELLSLRRDLKASTKVGCDAGALLWIGTGESVLIESGRVANVEYPDEGSSAEIYTNGDPNAYVELELLGPLETLNPGQTLERESRYTLYRRTRLTAPNEARRILGARAAGKLPH